jgi:hypothetical protein
MTDRCYRAAEVLKSALVANAPKDTWNLALNSIRVVQENGSWYVLIGGEIAPYAEYTNEAWKKGTNPNEGWIERSIEEVLPVITQIMSGALSEAEIDEWERTNYKDKITQDYAEHIANLEQKAASL